MDMAYTKEDLANIFEVVNQKLQLEGTKKTETKRSFKDLWKPDNLLYRLMVGWYNEITQDIDDSEIHDFVKKLNDKDKENRKLKKTLDRSEDEINSLKEEIKSQKEILSTERSKHKEQLECKDISHKSEQDSIKSLKETTHIYECMIQSRDTKIKHLENDLDEERNFTMGICRRRGLTETEPLQSDTFILQGSVVEDKKFTKYFKIISNKFKRKEHSQ